jgi:glycosyltransferase involved in cell wall biosynthesis
LADKLKLSVVVSCYNQEAYIADCLNSILNQKVNFDYEIIVADDCSPDRTREVINQFYEKHPKVIKLLYQDKNVGPAKNYLAVHNLAQGKYVAHFDGDDIMLPGKLQSQVDIMESNEDCHIVFHRARYFSDDRKYESDTGSLFQESETVYFSASELARWGTIAVHSSYMYRRSSRKTREYKEDFMEWFFAFESVYVGGCCAYITRVMTEYRCNPKGAAYLSSKAGREKAYLIIIKHVMDFYNELPEYRADLYAQQLINIMMYVKNIKKIKLNMVSFLILNLFNFSLEKVIQTIQVRRMVGPKKKIR